MTATATPSETHEQSVVLRGVSWRTYNSLRDDLDACDGQRVFLTYAQGDLEISSVLLHGIAWSTYDSLRHDLDARGQRIYLTYDHGDLEIMPPLPTHERWKKIIGGLIEAMAIQQKIPLGKFGSTTFRREDLDRGFEPDECYYVQNERAVRGKERLDLTVDPPPDLAIEVDVTRRSSDRQSIYTAVGVPELWRFNLVRMEFFALNNRREYHPIDRSIAFPILTPADLERFLRMWPAVDETTLACNFLDWVRVAQHGPDAGGT